MPKGKNTASKIDSKSKKASAVKKMNKKTQGFPWTHFNKQSLTIEILSILLFKLIIYILFN